MNVGDKLVTFAGNRGTIVQTWGGPPLYDETTLTVELELVGIEITMYDYHLEPWKNLFVKVIDPPNGHPYRSSLTIT